MTTRFKHEAPAPMLWVIIAGGAVFLASLIFVLIYFFHFFQ